MDLNKENMRKIRELIVFTIVILIGLWKYTLIADFLGFILNIIFPFLLGGAIAFILNVPMSFLESKIFGNDGVLHKCGDIHRRPPVQGAYGNRPHCGLPGSMGGYKGNVFQRGRKHHYTAAC